ncbi:hypothetical protein, partial [Escherichia coli]|uniref:hypothetical protein n=1 Tax=Escherichia coli TaxID=562 RepID=UPI001EDAEBAF
HAPSKTINIQLYDRFAATIRFGKAIAHTHSWDSALLGGPDQAGIVFEERYPGAFEIYGKRTDVRSSANIIIENSDFANPKLRLQRARLH